MVSTVALCIFLDREAQTGFLKAGSNQEHRLEIETLKTQANDLVTSAGMVADELCEMESKFGTCFGCQKNRHCVSRTKTERAHQYPEPHSCD